jgi:hypothetical protein
MQRLLEPMQQYLPARPKTTAAIITVSEMSSGDPRRPRRTWHQWVPRPVSPVPGVHADPRGTRPNRRAGRGFDPGFSYKISIRNSCDFSRGVNVSLYGVVHCRDAAVPHMVPLWVSPVPIPLNPHPPGESPKTECRCWISFGGGPVRGSYFKYLSAGSHAGGRGTAKRNAVPEIK